MTVPMMRESVTASPRISTPASTEQTVTNVPKVEYAATDELFTVPRDKRTEDYITGRFG